MPPKPTFGAVVVLGVDVVVPRPESGYLIIFLKLQALKWHIPKVSELVVVAVAPKLGTVKPPPNPNDGAALVEAGATAREDCVVPNPNVGAAITKPNKTQDYLI